MKTCAKCGQSRSFSEYNKNKNTKDGLQCTCNYCRKEYRLKNKEHIRLKNKEHHKKNAKQKIKRATLWNKEHPDRRRIIIKKDNYKRRYGLSLEDKQALIDNQNGTCAICNKYLNSSDKACVDHCHTSNIVRGILCNTCNSGLGMFKDSQENLKSALKYLKKHQKN
jgi:hypothetical protein